MTIVDNALMRILNILDVDDNNLTLLNELTQIQADILTEKLNGEIPVSLTFIVVETTIARYRRIGAEGISNKRLDVIQNEYIDNLFEPYEGIIAKYTNETGISNKHYVRVI